MKHRRLLFIRLSQFRVFVRKLFLLIVFVAALFFMVLHKNEYIAVSKVETSFLRALNPVVRVISLPADLVYKAYTFFSDIFFVYKKNALLEKENRQIFYLQTRLESLKAENALLSSMLTYTPPKEYSFITAKVIACEGDGFAHSLLAYIGQNSSVQKGQIVLGTKGAVGRIDAVYGKYARILLLTDITSKIPVLIKRNRTRAILGGNNGSDMLLNFVAHNADIKAGDEVVTSGIGGIFPADLPVGTVKSINADAIQIQPIEAFENLEYVKIVNYELYNDFLQDIESIEISDE